MTYLPPGANDTITIAWTTTSMVATTGLPLVPNITKSLHPTFKLNLDYWTDKCLGEYPPHYLNCSKLKAGWDDALQKLWGKRMRIHDIIVDTDDAKLDNEDLNQATEELDCVLAVNKKIPGNFKNYGIPRTVDQYLNMASKGKKVIMKGKYEFCFT